MTMYGTQDVAANWAHSYTKVIVKGDFVQGVASACNFVHKDGSTQTMEHGDDFLATGTREQLERLKQVLEPAYEIKSQVIGPWEGADRSMRVLGRIISFTETGIGYRHIESALAAYGMEDCNPLSAPWAAESRESVDLNLRRKGAQVSRVEEIAWKDDVESPGLGSEETPTHQTPIISHPHLYSSEFCNTMRSSIQRTQ